jgi:hypothetical protein
LVLPDVSRKQLRKRKAVSATFGGKIVEGVKICSFSVLHESQTIAL